MFAIHVPTWMCAVALPMSCAVARASLFTSVVKMASKPASSAALATSPMSLRAAIAARLETLGLELHPGKTKVAYCKDANRRGDFGHTSFDFLGYTFRGRLAKGPRGYFTGFSPAISATARKA